MAATAPQFDYYMRLDGGDSRLDMVAVDPFLPLQENSLRRARARAPPRAESPALSRCER